MITALEYVILHWGDTPVQLTGWGLFWFIVLASAIAK